MNNLEDNVKTKKWPSEPFFCLKSLPVNNSQTLWGRTRAGRRTCLVQVGAGLHPAKLDDSVQLIVPEHPLFEHSVDVVYLVAFPLVGIDHREFGPGEGSREQRFSGPVDRERVVVVDGDIHRDDVVTHRRSVGAESLPRSLQNAGVGVSHVRLLGRASHRLGEHGAPLTADVPAEATDAARADVTTGPTNGVRIVPAGAAGGVGGASVAAASLVGVGIIGRTRRSAGRHHRSAEGDDEEQTQKRHIASSHESSGTNLPDHSG